MNDDQTLTAVSPGEICSYCNIYFTGHHSCVENTPQVYGPFFGDLITVDQKLDKIIKLLEELIRKIS